MPGEPSAHLASGTDYEVQLGQAASRAITFRTGSNRMPIARTVNVAGDSQMLNITAGGGPGPQSPLMNNTARRGLTIRTAAANAMYSQPS